MCPVRRSATCICHPAKRARVEKQFLLKNLEGKFHNSKNTKVEYKRNTLVQRSVWPGGAQGTAMAPAEGAGQGRGDSGSEASRRTRATGGAIGEPVPVGKGRREGFLLRSETPVHTDSDRWHPTPLSHRSPGPA